MTTAAGNLGRSARRMVLIGALVALLGAACGGDDGDSSGSATTSGAGSTVAPDVEPLGTVTMRIEGDWPHLDPSGRTPGGGLLTSVLTNLLYDTLIVMAPSSDDPNKLVLAPYLAESYEASPTELSFVIKEGASCEDGTPVTASLVKRSIDTRIAAKTAIATMLGAGPYETTADDASRTFTLTLGAPYYDALYGFLELRIVCPAGIDNAEMLVNGAAGTGPYTLESAEHGNQAVFVRREDWAWGPNGITAKDIPAKVVAKVVTNETTAANLLVTGGLDVSRVGGAEIDRLRSDQNLENETTTSFYNNTLIFSLQPSSPTSDPVVREALSTAITREEWNLAANLGRGTVSTSFLQQKGDCYAAETAGLAPKVTGPDQARKILLDAGWTEGSGGKLQKGGKPLTIVLVSTTIPGLGNGGEYLAAQWDKAGITVDARITPDYNTFLQRGIKGEFDALTTNYPFDQPNPNRAVNTFTGSVDVNWVKAATPEIDEEMRLAEASDGAERCEHWKNVQMMLLEHHNVYPLASPEVNWFTRGIDIAPGASWSNALYFRRVG